MTNHFTSIGFPIYDFEALKVWANEALSHGEMIPVANGRYVRWQVGAGVLSCGYKQMSLACPLGLIHILREDTVFYLLV